MKHKSNDSSASAANNGDVGIFTDEDVSRKREKKQLGVIVFTILTLFRKYK